MDKTKIPLGISIALIVILAGVGAWLYTDLQNQILTLKDENSDLESQINHFNSKQSVFKTK